MSKQLYIRVEGELVSVTDEIYREYHAMGRRERYLEERDAAKGKVLYSNMDTDEMTGEDMIPDANAVGIEDEIVTGMMLERLRECLPMLTDDEQTLIQALFYDEMSEREYARTLGISKTALHARKVKILALLKKYMES